MGLFDDLRALAGGAFRAVGQRIDGGADIPPEAFAKAMEELGISPNPDEMGDRTGTPGRVADPTEEKPRGLYHDPYSIIDWGGWRERPSALTYETLRAMAAKNTVLAAIITLRCNQVAQFARPQQGKYDRGFRIIKRNRRDRRVNMTKAEQNRANEIEKMIETTAVLLPDEKASDRDSFRAFIKKGVRDILTYDQWCYEKIRDQSGRVSRFIALPSETIRPAVADIEHMEAAELRERVSHVQVYEDTVIAEFGPDHLAWNIMYPRSDLRVNTFGYSPVEQLIHLVTAWLYGFEYNQRFFSQGSAIKGILNVKGAIPDKQLRAFRRMWYAQVTGVTNAWRTPILNSEDIQWQSLHSTNREMEFSAWMDWLTKLSCAIFGVDPIEINFQFGNTGQSHALKEARQEEKVSESKDKGLRPLMDHIEDSLNRHIVWELAEDFELAFTGLEAKTEEEEREARVKEVTNYRTVDEVRADEELPPMPDGMGQVILSPTWMQVWTQKQQEQQQQQQAMQQQQQPGAPPGAPGEEQQPPGAEGGEEGSPPGAQGPQPGPGGPGGGQSPFGALGGAQAGPPGGGGAPPELQLERSLANVEELAKSLRRKREGDTVVIEFDI